MTHVTRWQHYTHIELTIMEHALRIYLGEIAGNSRAAAIAEGLQAEIAANLAQDNAR